MIGALVDGGIEAGIQIANNGEVSDWGAVGKSAAQGAILGATGAGLVRAAVRAVVVIKAARQIKNATQITARTTRAGEHAVKIQSAGGRVKDISPSRVKEFAPNTHPKAPSNAPPLKTKFDNPLPGTKGLKRDLTQVELEILKRTKPQ